MRGHCSLEESPRDRLGLELARGQAWEQFERRRAGDGQLLGSEPARRLGEAGYVVLGVRGQQVRRHDILGRDGVSEGLALPRSAGFPGG